MITLLETIAFFFVLPYILEGISLVGFVVLSWFSRPTKTAAPVVAKSTIAFDPKKAYEAFKKQYY